jgi:acetylornithine/N-succinyldiaminopimelate aminotransferase
MQLKDYGLTAEQVKELTKKYMIETYERFPFVAVRAKGMYLYDENDNAYLDFYGGIAVNSAGSCNEKVVAAVIDQVQQLMHTFNYPYSIPQALLAEKICEVTGMDKVFYQNSGAEANEAMIKLARKYGNDNFGPNRFHIVTAINGFHGRTFGALSATGQPESAIHKGFGPILPGFTYAEFNNLDSFKAAVTDDTIAIMIEPVQGEGGVLPATQEFIEGLRQLCDEKNMLLLFDEVQAGWFRTGTAMCYQSYGVTPDVVSMAKALGGGMPIGAIAAKDKVATAFNPGSHGSTYAGSPVCCAAALAEINELIDRKLGDNAKEVGAYFMEKLATLPKVKEVRGMGLFVGVEFDGVNAVDIKHNAMDRKLLTTAIGANIIRMVPPLIATKEDCDKCYAILKESVEALL